MKLKNVKRGVRVELKQVCRDKSETLLAGKQGTILESDDDRPYVQWDDFTGGHSACNPTVLKSVWAVDIKTLRRIK